MATISNGSILVAGGYNSEGQILSIVEKYDVVANKWHQLSPMAKGMAGGIIFEAICPCP